MERVLFAPRALPPLRPNVAEDLPAYSSWIEQMERVPAPGPPPSRRLGLVMPLSGEPPHELIQTLKSLEDQTSSEWSLTVVVEQAWRTTFTTLCTVSGLRRSSQRVRTIVTENPVDPGHGFTMVVAGSQGVDLALIRPGDVWSTTAVARLAGALTPTSVVYGDQDCMDDEGARSGPALKPAFSPEFLLHSSYIGRPLAIGSEVLARMAPPSECDPGWFEHDLALRATEVAERVEHIPFVLCHAATESLGQAVPPDTRHVQRALERRGESAAVTSDIRSNGFRVTRSFNRATDVSIIIPFRDHPRFLRTCVDSIDRTAMEHPFELILIDNGSEQPETATLLDRFRKRDRTLIVRDDRPFNWAELNNEAASRASGDVLIFLNDDIEAQRSGWLQALCAQATRPEVGVAGARLLYPDGGLQHGGVVIGLGGAAGHLLVGLPKNESGYLNLATTTRECAAVTGACFATRRDVFEQLGGFDASLGVDLNDVDYCLRAQLMGYRIIYESEAELIHFESPSRGTAGDVRDIMHFIDRWESTILQGDPYLNRHLTRLDSSCALRDPGEAIWWEQWRSNLNAAT